MTNKTDQLAIDLLQLLLSTINEQTPDQRREFAGQVHQTLVIADNRLCEQFKFSRRARGKFLLDKTGANKV